LQTVFSSNWNVVCEKPLTKDQVAFTAVSAKWRLSTKIGRKIPHRRQLRIIFAVILSFTAQSFFCKYLPDIPVVALKT